MSTRRWWMNGTQQLTLGPLERVGSAHVHPKMLPLVDATITTLERPYEVLRACLDRACDGLEVDDASRPAFATLAFGGSAIRTAFQPDPPDLDAKVLLLFAVEPSRDVIEQSGAVATRLLPRLVDALGRVPEISFHRLQASWLRPTPQQLLHSRLSDEPPWQAAWLWSTADLERGFIENEAGARANLDDGMRASRTFTLIVALDVAGLPVKLDIEVVPVPIDAERGEFLDLLAGYKVSTFGRAFFDRPSAVACRVVEQRALRAHGLGQVSNHVQDLVTDARSFYLGGHALKAVKLLVEPTVALGDLGSIAALEGVMRSPELASHGCAQQLRAIRVFEEKGTMPPEWAARRRRQLEPRVDDQLGELEQVAERAELRAREFLQERPEVLGRWFGFEAREG